MAVWKCTKCGATKESRCKPKKCPNCGEAEVMVKEGMEGETSSPKKRSCKK